ncbi:MAG: beta-ketoacyl-ACP synthase II [Spirochaetales bacterium]|nr:beta-ketoacyl-ACP synthase II [Spirochaetales bacterium]
MKKRIVVTGMGTVNPLGNSVDEFWTNIKANKCGIGPNTRFDTTEYESKIFGEVKNFIPSDHMDSKAARKMGLFTLYAVAAAKEAMKMAGLEQGGFDPERAGSIVGNGIGGFEILESAFEKLFTEGPKRIPPMTIPKLIANECPGNIAIMHGLKGPCYTVTTACASGTDAIGNAMLMIESDFADVVVTGGTESALTKLGIGGFCRLMTLSTGYNDTPEKASRPFDRDRDGFVIAEGAGILVIEEYEHAKKRGAHILAELAGYGMSCDAYHLTSPHSDGLGAIQAMNLALKSAGMKPEEIDYVNAHGTSTPTNDPIETKAIKTVFGDHAYKFKVSSTKGMTGHLVGGAGGVEAIISVLAMRDNFFPATLNLENPDPECDLDYVPQKGVPGTINAVMSNSLGFGGHNGVLVLKKYTE